MGDGFTQTITGFTFRFDNNSWIKENEFNNLNLIGFSKHLMKK